jgi:hypothetical protein
MDDSGKALALQERYSAPLAVRHSCQIEKAHR